MHQFTEAEKIWNRACGRGGACKSRAGDLALSSLIVFHSVAMNGGVLHAIESCSEAQTRAAVDGYRYFGLVDASRVVEEGQEELRAVQTRGGALAEIEALEAKLDRRYNECVPDDDTLVGAFHHVLERQASDFESP